MKRYSLLSLLLVFALMLTLFAGCGTKPDSSAASAAAETSEVAPVEAGEVSAAEPDAEFRRLPRKFRRIFSGRIL